jgi:hypothetical protein
MRLRDFNLKNNAEGSLTDIILPPLNDVVKRKKKK